MTAETPIFQLAAVLPHIARVTNTNDRLGVARSAAEAVLEVESIAPAVEVEAKRALAEACAASGEMTAAERLYNEIAQIGRFPGSGGDGWTAVAVGRMDDALTHFEAEIESARRGGYGRPLAWACAGSAEVLADRDEPGDREKALELQDEALAITQELGMRPLTERILARREILRA